MTNKIYAIRLKSTGEFQVYNGRCAWTKRGNAINAFNRARPLFDNNGFEFYEENGVYEIIELTELVWMYEDLQK